MNRTSLIVAATAGSVLLLGGAFAFEHLGGMPPCKLCIWQRWAHVAVIVAGSAALAIGMPRAFAVLGGVAVLIGAGVAGYHVGVEQQWWMGPATCGALPSGSMSAEDRLAQLLETPVIRCDEIPWSLAGISMAGWNGVVSVGLGAVWFLAATRTSNPTTA